MTDFSSMSDEELLSGSRDNGETAELISRYLKLVFAIARRYSRDADYEELVSDGMQALLSAISGYDREKGSFAAFAQTCIANRMKNTVDRSAKRAARFADEDEMMEMADLSPSPEERVIARESTEEFRRGMRTELTDMERRCLEGVIMGLSYAEIAERTGEDRKSVDNAIARARAKLRRRFPKT